MSNLLSFPVTHNPHTFQTIIRAVRTATFTTQWFTNFNHRRIGIYTRSFAISGTPNIVVRLQTLLGTNTFLLLAGPAISTVTEQFLIHDVLPHNFRIEVVFSGTTSINYEQWVVLLP